MKIPEILSQKMGAKVAPLWVCKLAGRESDERLASLHGFIFEGLGQADRKALVHFTGVCLRSLVNDSAYGLAIDFYCSPSSDFLLSPNTLEKLNLSVRTRKRISTLLGRQVSKLTFKELWEIPGMGINSIAEFLLEVEAHRHYVSTRSISLETSIIALKKFDWDSWCTQLYLGDPRFEQQLSPLKAVLAIPNTESLTLSELAAVVLDGVEKEGNALLCTALCENYEILRVAWFEEQKKPLNVVLRELLQLLARTKRNTKGKKRSYVQVMLDRLGWSQNDPRTLEECGEDLGVTRERIRQVEAKLRGKIKGPVVIPQLHRANELLATFDGLSTESAAKSLVTSQISTIPLSPSGIINALDFFGQRDEIAFEVSTFEGQKYIRAGGQDIRREVLRCARRLCSRNGVASGALISKTLGLTDESVKSMNQILSEASEFVSLDEQRSYWYYPTTRNRLLNIMDRVFTCTRELEVGILREAIKKVYRFRNSTTFVDDPLMVPSLEALLALAEYLPNFKVNGNQIQMLDPKKPEEVLGESDLVFYRELMASRKGFLSRRELIERSTAAGILESTAQVNLTYTAIIESAAVDAWKLIGRPVDPVALSNFRDLRKNRASSEISRYHGWLEGKIGLVAEIGRFNNSFTAYCPSIYQRFLVPLGEIQIEKISGVELGTLKFSGNTLYGFYKFMNFIEAEEGDLLLMLFDIENKTVRLSVEPEHSLIEQFE